MIQYSMKKYLFVLSTLLLVGLSHKTKAQVESMNSLYRISPGMIFPALSGADSISSFTAFTRQQWFGFKGAPTTYGAHFSGKIQEKMGVGIIAMHDQAGPVRNILLGGDYSYRLKFSDKVSILGGIRIALVNHTIAFTDLDVIHQNDPNLQQNYTTGFQLNGGWSAAFVAGDFFLSVAEPRVRRFNFQDAGNTTNFIDAANYYAMTGYNFKTKYLDIEPSVLLRLAENVPVSTDFNLLLRYKKTLDLAMTYRSKSSYGVRAGVLTAQKLYLTYLYEVPAAVGVRAGYQSHELAVKYFLGK